MDGTPLIGCGRSKGLWEENIHPESAEKFGDDPIAHYRSFQLVAGRLKGE